MRSDRLLKLADYLETVPRKKFDMNAWAVQSECGFSGCAIGWAAHGKLFRGLTLAPVNSLFVTHQPKYVRPGNRRAKYQFGAASDLFEIESSDARELFSERYSGRNETYDTPKQVAKRIRKFVRDHSNPSQPT